MCIEDETKPKKDETKPKKDEAKPKKDETKPKKDGAKPKLGYAFEITITIITIICIMCIALVEVTLLVKFFKLSEVEMRQITATIPLITAIVIFGILLLLAARQILSIKFKNLIKELKELKDRTDQLTYKVTDFVKVLMSEDMYIYQIAGTTK